MTTTPQTPAQIAASIHESATLEHHLATDSAFEWFDHEIRLVESLLRDLTSCRAAYRERIAAEDAGDPKGRNRYSQPEDEIATALNYMKSVGFNSRVDLAPSVVSRHRVAREHLRLADQLGAAVAQEQL